jgi:hypothetical protein
MYIARFMLLLVLLSAILHASKQSLADAPTYGEIKNAWTTNETSTWDGKKLTLTTADGSLLGAGWCTQEVDLKQNLDLEFKVNLGAFDDEGADGIVFVLTNAENPESSGEGLGYFGLTPSFALEIDTYPNDGEHMGDDQGDPAEDHLAIDINGVVDHHESQYPVIGLGNIEDDKEHILHIKWDASKKLFIANLDNRKTPLISTTTDIVNDIFGGSSKVKIGFTGSTGFCANLQYIVPVKMTWGTPPVPASQTTGDWKTMEAATWDCNKILLTTDEGDMVGAAWYSKQVDLTKNFDFRFKVFLGLNDEFGADGIVFLLAPKPAVGLSGHLLGINDISPSFGIELDTYPNDGEHVGDNQGDPLEDHVAFDIDGSASHIDSNLPVVKVANLEDSKAHDLRITWSATEKILNVYIDPTGSPVPVNSYKIDLIKHFNGISKVSFGFTGSTGMAGNIQYVIPVKLFE